MRNIFFALMIAAVSISIAAGQTRDSETAEKQVATRATKSEPKIFVVFQMEVRDAKLYEQYRVAVEPLIKKYGGKYLVRSGGLAYDNDPGTKLTPLEGDWNPDRFIIIQWDSIEQLQKFTGSEEYKKIAVLRERSAATRSLLVREYLNN